MGTGIMVCIVPPSPLLLDSSPSLAGCLPARDVVPFVHGRFGLLEFKPFLLSDCLCRHNFRQPLQPWRLEPRRSVRLECCDDAWLRDLVRAAVLHVHGRQQEYVPLFRHSRSDRLHDVTVDRLLVVGNQVLIQELLNLVR